MTNAWHWFVILGTIFSLIGVMWLLFSNRRTSGEKTTGHEWDGIEELDNPLPLWWVWMFVGSVIFAVLYLIYYPGLGNVEGAGAWSSAQQHDVEMAQHKARFAGLYANYASVPSEELMNDRQAMQIGRRLFINHCSTCHGVNAAGAFGFPNLTDDEWIWGGSYDAVAQTLKNGRIAAMPAWGPALGETGVAQVTQYVMQLSGQEHDAEAASAGRDHYNTLCVACHGLQGKGNPMLGAPDLTNDLWLYGGTVDRITFTLTHGRQGNMPAQLDLLGEDKIHILTTYVRSLSQ